MFKFDLIEKIEITMSNDNIASIEETINWNLDKNRLHDAAELLASQQDKSLFKESIQKFAKKVIDSGRLDLLQKMEALLERRLTPEEQKRMNTNGEIADIMYS